MTAVEKAWGQPNWLRPWWKMLPKRWGHRWHSMCSYLAMFPPSIPRYFIEQCSRPGDVVYDPFSGRGTTPLEACLAGRVGIGSDANPLAVVLTKAKVDAPSLENVLRRLRELANAYRKPDMSGVPPEIRQLFDGRRTLPQLLFLRGQLNARNVLDNFLLATLCGILHGNHPKNQVPTRTLSISMPNTFSMSPRYIARYKRRHRLRKHAIDVFGATERRLRHLYSDNPPPVRGFAFRADARRVDQVVPRSGVDLVVTSPPYLNVIRYGKYNWIRLWLLGHTSGAVDASIGVEQTDKRLGLADRLHFEQYQTFICDVLTGCATTLRPGGYCVVVIGDVVDKNKARNLAADTWARIQQDVPLKIVDIVDDTIVSGKVTRIWGGRKGAATKVDRMLILRKPGRAFCRPRMPSSVIERLKC